MSMSAIPTSVASGYRRMRIVSAYYGVAPTTSTLIPCPTTGLSYGETDELGFNITRDKVHVHDLQATLLNQLGFDHERLTFKFEGRNYRLTDVHGSVVKGILS
jgi:hypothetical protein